MACCLCLFVWVAGLHSGTAGEEPARSQRELELGYFSQVPTWFVYEIFFLRLKVGNLHLGFRGVKLLLV